MRKYFPIYEEVGAVAKSYKRKSFLIYDEMRKYFPIYEEAVSHICLCTCYTLNFLIYEENLDFLFYQCIVLDARVPRVPVLGPGALRVDSNNADKLLTSRQFTRPKSFHATTLENDRCIRFITFL